MTSRQIEILKLLRGSPYPITLDILAKQFNVSIRTIQNDLSNINADLHTFKLRPIQNQLKKGLIFNYSKEDIKIIDNLIYQLDNQKLILSPDDRLELLYNIFLFQKDYVTLTELSYLLNVSRNTVLNDLKRLRKAIEDKPIRLLSNSHSGIRLTGDEISIRQHAVNLYIDSISPSCLTDFNSYFNISISNRFKQKSMKESKIIYDNLVELSQLLHIRLTDHSFLLLISNIELALERIKIGRLISLTTLQLESLYVTQEFKIMYQMANKLSSLLDINIPIEEVAYFTLLLFSSDLQDIRKSDENYAELQIAVCDLIHKIAKELKIDLCHDTTLYHNLLFYLRRAVFRMKYHIQQKNSLNKEIYANYKYVYDAVARNISIIEKMTNTIMTEDEIGFITIHFITVIEKLKTNKHYIPNVIIVCDSGIGTSHLLATRLQALYDVNIIDIIALHELENALKRYQVNFIISTLNLMAYDKPVIKVTPFINDGDMEQLDKYLHRQGRVLAIDERRFFEVLEQDCKIIRDKEHLIENLSKEFNLVFKNNNRKDVELMLKDVISKNMIELNFHATNWEEAVREAGKLLQNGHCIEQGYIDSMVNTVKTMGSYIVIAKGIALPHSRSGEYAHKVGISFLRLADPVEFGHKENDPVDLLFGLSSTDNKTHIGVLKDLVKILTDENNIEFLRTATSVDEIYHFLIK